MKRGSILFLKIWTVLLAIGVLSGLIWFPQTEGRAVGLDLISIYTDPFIIYVYIGSTPFFYSLFQLFKLLNLVEVGKAFSQEAISRIKKVKFASLGLIGFIVIALLFIRFAAKGEDSAGPTMLGIIVSLVVVVKAAVAAVAEKLVQNALDLKSENDLTV